MGNHNKEVFQKHLAPTSHFPVGLEVDYANGSTIYDVSGKRYIDLIAGIGVSALGHQHPLIKESIINQLNKHSHVMVYGEYIQQSVNDLACRLTSMLPPSLSNCYFVNSGTEANEGAIKLAKRVTGRTQVIAFKRGYHGNTQGSMSISANEEKKRTFRPLIPGVSFIAFNDIDELEQITEKTAAVIIEPVQGDAGVIVPSRKFMKSLRSKCLKTGAQLIFDEVQTGVGRTGKMFAFEHFDVAPDILTLAKGLGGGLPIGAFISSLEKMTSLADNPMLGHITTFGGNPVSCAAANAVLEIVNDAAFLQQVERKGALFEELLGHPQVVAIRRIGLMLAIELASEELVNKAIGRALENGIIIYWFLSTRNAFRISPPLNISDEDIRNSCKKLVQVFDSL